MAAYLASTSRWRASAGSCCASSSTWRAGAGEGESVVLKLLSRRGKRRCVIDGELLPLANETLVEIHKKALNVLVPAEPQAGKAG